MTSVRNTVWADAPAILRLADAEPLFSKEDREVVEELLADFLADADASEYRFLTAVDGAKISVLPALADPTHARTYDLY
jgi:hypothetical protein